MSGTLRRCHSFNEWIDMIYKYVDKNKSSNPRQRNQEITKRSKSKY